MGYDYGRDERKEANAWVRWLIIWTLVGLLIIGLITAAIFIFNTVISGPKGQADAYQKKNSSENWTAAQRRFESEFQDIQATDRKIAVAQTAAKADPSDQTKADNFTGLQSYCLSVVADYNTDARSYLSEDFRAADLPQQIDNDNPATDCK